MKWKLIVIAILVVMLGLIGMDIYKNLQPPQFIFDANIDAEVGTILSYLKEHNYQLVRKREYPILFVFGGLRQDMYTLQLIDPFDILKSPNSTVGLSPDGIGSMGLSGVTVTIDWLSKVPQMRIQVPGVGYGLFDIDTKGNLIPVDQVSVQPPPNNR